LIELQGTENEYVYLSNLTHFDEDTLRLLHVRFKSIDRCIEEDSRISLQEFAACIEMSPNSILVSRFFKYIDSHNLGLTFRVFATTMSALCEQASIMEKIRLTFHLYDLNDDGHIDRDELTDLISDCITEMKPLQLTNECVQTIVNNTFDCVAHQEADRISFEEYYNFITSDDRHIHRFIQPFCLDVTKLIHYEAESRREKRYTSKSVSERELHHGYLFSFNAKKGIMPFMPDISIGIDRVNSIHDAQEIHSEFHEKSETSMNDVPRAKSLSFMLL